MSAYVKLKALAEPDSSRTVAERAALERLLNAYLREAGRSPAAPVGRLPLEVMDTRQELLALPFSGGTLLGTIRYHSEVGLHHFGRKFWWATATPSPSWESQTHAQVIERILSELAGGSSRASQLHGQVLNSIEKTARYLTAVPSQTRRADGEDSLLFGHPLHPTPKSTEGFEPDDLARYAPELGASFQLDYLEVKPELLQEETLSGHALPLPGVLPVHPWQSRYLQDQPWMQKLIHDGLVSFRGPSGPMVQPTSSVRTVRCGDSYFKLPLNVRITNYYRLNYEEHLRRSLDVGRAIAAGPSPSAQATSTVLQESGWRSLRLPDEQSSQCGVLFRRAPTGKEPVVLAALLEATPDGEAGAMMRVLTRAAGGQRPDAALVLRWLRAYLQIALPAVMGWWLERGVSLEAHVQNSLVTLCQGWPTRLWLRDLEGGSLWSDHPHATWVEVGIDPQSPALYAESHAWHRLLYYFFVNHLGHLVATLALCSPDGRGERALWDEVNAAIHALPEMGPPELSRKYRRKLLEAAHLPAKANLTSRFQNRSENPLYVAIPNPFCDRGSNRGPR